VPTGIGAADDVYEREAEAAADQVLAGGAPPRLTWDRSGLLRRAISVVPGSAKLKVTTRPNVQTPTINAGGGIANWGSDPIRCTGEVSITGSAAERLLAFAWNLQMAPGSIAKSTTCGPPDVSTVSFTFLGLFHFTLAS